MSKVTLNPVVNKMDETIKYGDLFEWTEKSEHEGKVCLLSFSGLVDLTNPHSTWSSGKEALRSTRNHINEGFLIKLPKGYNILIEQE